MSLFFDMTSYFKMAAIFPDSAGRISAFLSGRDQLSVLSERPSGEDFVDVRNVTLLCNVAL